MQEKARYSKLAEITRLINSKLELREALEQVVIAISEEIIQCDAVGIYMPEDDGNFRGYVGKPDNINGITLDQMVVDPNTDLLAKEILETRKSVYIPDTSKDNRADPRPIALFKIKSLLGLPICYEEEIYGLVFLFIYGSPMPLTHDEIETIEAYVNMAAVAIRNTKLFSHKEKLLAEKQILLDATKDLTLCLTSQEVLDVCCRYVGKVLSNKDIAVHLRNAEGEEFFPFMLSDDSNWNEKDWRNVHQKLKVNFKTDRLFNEVLRNKRPSLIPDVDMDPRPNHEVCKAFGIKGLLIIPMVAMGEVLGTVTVASFDEVMQYQPSELGLVQSIVEATATALDNIFRKEEILRRADSLFNVGELAASISHEVRNPLTVIRGFIQILREKESNGTDTYYDIIIDELDRATEIISDYLSLAKNKIIERKECNLNQILEELSPILRADANMKGQLLELILCENLPYILFNEKEIKQVILNLVRNGMEAMGPNGQITISTKETKGKVELRITDTGCGIPKDRINKLFEPFYTTKEKGTGLGLTVCKSIVTNHGGNIKVESTEGQGTTFIVILNKFKSPRKSKPL